MKKFLLMAVAALTSFNAMAIDKVTMKTASPDEMLAYVKSGEQFSIQVGGQMISFNNQDVSGAATTVFTFAAETPVAIEGEDYTDKYTLRVYENGQGRNFWGAPSYLNFHPTNGAFFGLGLNNQNGTDAKNGAVWTVTTTADGVAFQNMANSKYIGGAAPGTQSATPVSCTIPEAAGGYDPAEVVATDDQVKVCPMQATVKAALDAARTAYESDKTNVKLIAYANAVNAAISSLAYANIVDGKYYIKNNESGLYLSNGANWGTRSTLMGLGLQYDVVCGNDGKYTLKSGVKNGSLRPSDGFNDQSGAWELIACEGGFYMFNGSKYFCNDVTCIPRYKDVPDASCVWSVVTEADRKAALSLASESNPVDATVYIKQADFVPNVDDGSSWSRYKIGGDTGSGANFANSQNNEQWMAGAFTSSQVITDLPNGTYRVSCQGFTRKSDANTASADSYEAGDVLAGYLFAGNEKVALKSIVAEAPSEANGGWAAKITSTSGNTYYIPNSQTDAAKCFSAGAYWNAIEEVVVKDGTLELGITSEGGYNWTVWDSFRLTYYGNNLSLDDYIDALNDAVAEAKAIDGKMSTSVADALKQTIEKYDGKTLADADAYTAATQDVKNAIAEANASVELYEQIAAVNAKAAALTGADAAAAYAEVLATYENGTATAVAPFEAAYLNAVKVAGPGSEITALASDKWVGMTGLVAEQYCPDGPGYPERYQAGAFTGDVMTQTLTGLKKGTYRVTMVGGASYTSGRGFEGATGQNHAYFFANDALQSLEVYDRAVIAAGTVETAVLECGVNEDGVLKFGIQNITTGANWFVINLVKIEYLSTDLPPVDVDMVIGESKWATFMAPFDVKVPAGVTAFTAVVRPNGRVDLTKVTTIKANTPVMLNGEASKNTVSGVSRAESLTYQNGCLIGTYGDLEITEGYVLQNQPEAQGIAFYAVSADNAKTVPANHAYAVYEPEDEPIDDDRVKVLAFDTEATAINALNALTSGKAEIYDMNGRQINKLQKGVNIVNGVKVLVK